MRGTRLFITFEGIEGSGKTSQIASLAWFLRRTAKLSVVLTREPGGTWAGDRIRTLVLGPRAQALDPWAELFLMEAARAQHLAEVIRPALRQGKTVLCDRFTDSTIAYQGRGRGLPLEVLRRLHALPALGPKPDLTVLFDLPVREGLARARRRNAASPRPRMHESRMDEESAAFHERVRRGYREIARDEPGRVIAIAAGASPEAIRHRLRAIVLARLGLPSPS